MDHQPTFRDCERGPAHEMTPFRSALERNKRWGDAASLASVFLVISLLAVASFMADSAEADPTTRIGMYLTMIGVVLAVCIWQAAAFAAAAVEAAGRGTSERHPGQGDDPRDAS